MAGPSFQLVMLSGPNPGKAVPLDKNEIHIGRDLGNDIVINDAEVSRRHARLVLQTGGYVLEDMGSTNGTSVNGQRLIGPYLLRVGDLVAFGEHVTLEFESVKVDPDATIATAVGQPVEKEIPEAPPPVPVHSFPATTTYSGQVPEGPVPEVFEPPAEERQRKPGVVIGLIAGIFLLAVCACGGILWYIDTNVLWCDVFPFLPGCP